MTKKPNPADKLSLPQPPPGCYWKVYVDNFTGERMGLYQKSKYWFDRRIDSMGAYIFSGNLASALEEAAQNIIERQKRLAKEYHERNALWDDKIYLDDLIDAPEFKAIIAQD